MEQDSWFFFWKFFALALFVKMSNDKHNNKKRKRPVDEAPAEEERLKFRVKHVEQAEIGPIVGLYTILLLWNTWI